VGRIVIRLSEPEDTPEIERLCLAQFARTPWNPGVLVAEAFHVYDRDGHITGCLAYRRQGSEIQVIHVWVEDGFSGRRAAVELMTDLENMADAERCDLAFDTMPDNTGLRAAVEEHGCQAVSETPGSVDYRREARAIA